MRKVALFLLLIVGGCANNPRPGSDAPSDTSRWRVLSLEPGSQSFGNTAILLDSQTGDTWISWGNVKSWQKMSK